MNELIHRFKSKGKQENAEAVAAVEEAKALRAEISAALGSIHLVLLEIRNELTKQGRRP